MSSSEWEPLRREELDALIAVELGATNEGARKLFARIRRDPVLWRQPSRGFFWAVGIYGPCVLWYDDVESGFGVSKFVQEGSIPDGTCGFEDLGQALDRLRFDGDFYLKRREGQ